MAKRKIVPDESSLTEQTSNEEVTSIIESTVDPSEKDASISENSSDQEKKFQNENDEDDGKNDEDNENDEDDGKNEDEKSDTDNENDTDEKNDEDNEDDEKNPLIELFEKHILSQKKPKNKKRKKNQIECSSDDTPFFFTSSPKYITGTLRDYQIEGVNWLISMNEKNINCILADEMGLGKTLQTITFLGYLKTFKNIKVPHLLIVPKSLLHNWKSEFKKFLPSFKIFIFHCPFVELNQYKKKMEKQCFDVILTTYEMIITAQNIFKKTNWSYLIIDEAHRIKNDESILSKIVRLLDVEHRLLLTGTPLQNNIKELWALLNFLDPKLFKNFELFEKWCNEFEIDQLRRMLQCFFLRREKKDVETKLLPKKIINLYPELTSLQKDLYRNILLKDLTPLLNNVINHSKNNKPEPEKTEDGQTIKEDPRPVFATSKLLNVLIQLRKCCNHPYLFYGLEPHPFEEGEHLVDNSGKMRYLDKLLLSLKEKGSRVLIFSQMTTMLDILEDYCNYRNFENRRIDGSTGVTERGEYIDDFNKEDSDIFIFLLSTRAGGLGINLATADTVIMYDSDWNPQIDLQAQDRAHRIGQTKQVTVYKFISENTIEEKIIYRALKKLKLDEILIQKKQKDVMEKDSLGEKEIFSMLSAGVDKIFDSKNSDEKEINLDEIIRVGQSKTEKLNTELENITIEESQTHQMAIYEFEGEDYKNKQKALQQCLAQNRHLQSNTQTSSLFSSERKRIFTMFLPDWQFFPVELKKLVEKEKKTDLTESEQQKINELKVEGFTDWTKRDYLSFCKAVEQYGKYDIEKYTEIIHTKNIDEIKKYSDVFWKRFEELDDHGKLKNNFTRAASKRNNDRKIFETLNVFFSENCTLQLKNMIHSRSRLFNNNLDKIILKEYSIFQNEQSLMFNKILKDIKQIYQFNYTFRLLNITDIKKRLKSLKSNLIRASNTVSSYQTEVSSYQTEDSKK